MTLWLVRCGRCVGLVVLLAASRWSRLLLPCRSRSLPRSRSSRSLHRSRSLPPSGYPLCMRAPLAFVLFITACGSTAPAPHQEPPLQQTPPHESAPPPPLQPPAESTMVEGVYFSMPGAPEPRACTASTDCIIDTAVSSDGCCVREFGLHPQSWPWHTWVSQHRMSATCASAACPPPPNPVPPEPGDCHMVAQCVAGRCGDACMPVPPAS